MVVLSIVEKGCGVVNLSLGNSVPTQRQKERYNMKQYWNVYCNGVLAWNCRTKKDAEDAVILMKSLSIHVNDNLVIKRGGLYG